MPSLLSTDSIFESVVFLKECRFFSQYCIQYSNMVLRSYEKIKILILPWLTIDKFGEYGRIV